MNAENGKAIAVLQTTKQIVHDNEWGQGYYAQDPNGKVLNLQQIISGVYQGEYKLCVLGSLSMANHKHKQESNCKAEAALAIAANIVTKESSYNPATYNDKPTTTKNKIVKLIDKAISLLEEGRV